MARMIPEVEASQLEHTSEQPVYQALRDGLSDEFVVLHSYPWLRPWRGEKALVEGEADFVILHPHHGLLVLEVKGGVGIRHDGNRWFRDSREGPREFQDPFRQAQRSVYALLEIIEQRSGRRISRQDFAYGYAVVFPHVDYEGKPPPHADEAIVISRRHLPFMEQAIVTAIRAWTEDPEGPHTLSDDRFQMLLYECLMPQFRVFRPIGADLSLAADQLLVLTETQAAVFEGLYDDDRVLVEGVAGSGKTLLALRRALAFAREGKRTLLVCYNKELADWLQQQVVDDPLTGEYEDRLTCQNFHRLAAELAQSADIGFRPADGGRYTQVFWTDEVPDLMEQACLALDLADQPVAYDAIVVDEAQDFALSWWYVLTESLLTVPDGPLYAFMDPHQSLWGRVEAPPIDFDSKFRLKINCRNTRKIAAASATVLDLPSSVFAHAPSGVQPRLLRAASAGQQKGLVLQELQRLLGREDLAPRQIAVIGPAAKRRGSLADVDQIAGVPIVTEARAWRDGDGLLVTTARSFKGLEADVVLLYDLNEFGEVFRKEDLYVACTRAKVLLIAVVHGEECRDVIQSAFDVAGQHE